MMISTSHTMAETTTTTATTGSLAALLPHELLVKIFYNLEQRPQHRHSSTSSISFSSSLSLQRTDILSCALVCQDWYYAAVDTLWREVDLQSVESFIQFSRTLDPDFSYVHAHPTPRDAAQENRRRYSRPLYNRQGHECNRDELTDDKEEGKGVEGLLDPFNIASHRRIGQRSSTSASSAASAPSSGPSSSSLDSSCSMSSLRGPPSPDHVGHAGKGFIRSFSLAGTSDCQAPRPFPYLPSCITDRHLSTISSSLTHLTSLSLSHCTALTDLAAIQVITASSPYLRRIDLTECRLITNLTVQVIAQLCSRQLEELSLQGCGLVTDEAIEELAYRCTRLRQVNIGQCARIGDRALLALLRASGRMTLPNQTLSKTRTKNAQLSKLGVAGCNGITLAGLLAIADHLSLSKTTEAAEDEFGDGCSSLISLEFTCPAIKVHSKAPLEHAPVISSLARPKIPSHATRFFRTLPPTLEVISIYDAYTLSQDDVLCLVDRVGTSLKTLKLDNANAVNTDTLAHILEVCPKLTVLCIPRATRLSDYGVIQLATAKCASSLVELDLSACHALTDMCLTRLATVKSLPCSSLSPSPPVDNSKGKGVTDRNAETPCYFPNLRRLDLSYNDKMTLTGIIPLVLSLKNLCALDVSFCGDGVTRSWSSSLESLRPMLNPTRRDERELSSGWTDLQHRPSVAKTDCLQSTSSTPEPYEQSQQVTNASSTVQQVLSLQNLQQLVSNGIPATVPSRRGLGRYVGPMLNRTAAASQDNSIAPHHPQQYPGQGLATNVDSQHYTRRRSSASSTSSFSSTSSSASASSSSSSVSSSASVSPSSSSSSLEDPSSLLENPLTSNKDAHRSTLQHHRRRSPSRVILAERLDVLDNTPRRVGIPASFHLESWFTPQHHHQLQQLYQIQAQRNQDVRDAVGQLGAGVNLNVQQHLMLVATTVPSLPVAMMDHPIIRAPRVGVAIIPSGGDLQQQQQEQPQHPTSVQEMSESDVGLESTGRIVGLGSGHGGIPGSRAGLARRHHHRQHQQYHYHRRGSAGNGSYNGIIGQCEISAWGLSKLKAEWSMT